MKNKKSLFVLSLLVLSGFIFMSATPTAQAQDGDNTIVIGTVAVGNEYNDTDIQLQPNVEYTIIFVNTQAGVKHNLRIDVNQNIEDGGDVADSGDILIGEENDTPESEGVGQWEGTWTPTEDGEYIFYCGTAGHYPGMEGVFTVGEGESPGFGLVAGLVSVVLAAVAIPQLRKRN